MTPLVFVVGFLVLLVLWALGTACSWHRIDVLERENRRLQRRAERAERQGYHDGWADAVWTLSPPEAVADDEHALARHHAAAVAEGLIPPPPDGLTNDPRWS